MEEKRINLICQGYERKLEQFRDFQLGHDLHKVVIPVNARKTNNISDLSSICTGLRPQERKAEIVETYNHD